MAKVSLTSRFAHLIGGFKSSASPAAIIAGAPAAEVPEEMDAEKPVKKDDESQEDFDKRLKEWEDAQEDDPAAESEGDEKKKEEAAKAVGFASGFTAGGKRWEDVLAHAEAGGRMVTACTLLSENPAMSADSIIKTLATCPREANKVTLADRRAAEPVVIAPAPGAQPAPTGSDAEWAANVAKTADQFRAQPAAVR